MPQLLQMLVFLPFLQQAEHKAAESPQDLGCGLSQHGEGVPLSLCM